MESSKDLPYVLVEEWRTWRWPYQKIRRAQSGKWEKARVFGAVKEGLEALHQSFMLRETLLLGRGFGQAGLLT